MKVVIAVDRAGGLVEGLQREGIDVIAELAASALATAVDDRMLGGEAETVLQAVAEADAVIVEVSRATMSSMVVALCDRAGTRIVPLCADEAGRRVAAACGLETPLSRDAEPWRIADALAAAPQHGVATPADRPQPRVIVVWGPAGAPGRSTVATELAVELARGGRHVALVDADTHAPSLALTLGLADEGPGFAAACRQAELGGLDGRELTRIALPLGRSGVDVLTGLNRPSRWPELSERRVTAALAACRAWADYTVVDVAAPLERDEEIMSDLEGPRRNAATLAALRAADLVVAVAGADPLGVARFLRAHADLRAIVGATPVAVVANCLRPGALGIDARGQVRRTLDRFGGVGDVWFLPQDPRSADAALLSARPIAEVAPKSPLTLAVRRFAGEAVVAPPEAGRSARRRDASDASPAKRPGARRPRRPRDAPAPSDAGRSHDARALG
ncbi:P-loop NTPase [Microbacterium sp. HD4P20]|uniref:AAA family ATPase n=1 Tax=Microbacterium sp. HD4P20 TaxID=2864874 RepID=UPI001C643C5C|nr:P-loop NTPase [Microbacterium sp. HD4P20]MCP2637468.1 P-loop NTPase [Microbacterium sp. HD4P20]